MADRKAWVLDQLATWTPSATGSGYAPLYLLTPDEWAALLATIEVESAFDDEAYREEPAIGDASRGLGQLLLGTARKLGYTGPPDGLFDPQVNLTFTLALLGLLKSAGLETWGEIASAYNCGLVNKAGVKIDVPGQSGDAGGPYRSRCATASGYSNAAHVTRWLEAFARWQEAYPTWGPGSGPGAGGGSSGSSSGSGSGSAGSASGSGSGSASGSSSKPPNKPDLLTGPLLVAVFVLTAAFMVLR